MTGGKPPVTMQNTGIFIRRNFTGEFLMPAFASKGSRFWIWVRVQACSPDTSILMAQNLPEWTSLKTRLRRQKNFQRRPVWISVSSAGLRNSWISLMEALMW